MTEEQVFTQEKYGVFVRALDDVMQTMKDMGKSEKEAQEWLESFVTNHYFKVWRPISR
jgi:hypothetical protein